MLIATPYSLSAHERGQLGPVDYLAGPGDVWESRLKAEDKNNPCGWVGPCRENAAADRATVVGLNEVNNMDHIGHAVTSFLCPRARGPSGMSRSPPLQLLIRARHVGASRAVAEHRCYLAARQGRQRCRYSLYRCAARVAGFLSTLSPRSLGRHRNHTFIYKPTATPRPSCDATLLWSRLWHPRSPPRCT